jgi:hypothetical protein
MDSIQSPLIADLRKIAFVNQKGLNDMPKPQLKGMNNTFTPLALPSGDFDDLIR